MRLKEAQPPVHPGGIRLALDAASRAIGEHAENEI